MKTLQQALENNSKVWGAGSKERVYVQDVVRFAKEVCFSTLTENEMTYLKKSKIYFDVTEQVLKSDVGTVRSLLNGNGIVCKK